MAAESDELGRLRNTVDELTARLARMESRLNALEGRNLHPAATASSSLPFEQEHTESRIGLTFINRVGALTLAVGIIFFFKYAADNEWIGPWGRVLIGLMIGFALIAAGDWLSKRDQRVFSQGILGCGLASIYVSLYASFEFYKLLPQVIGILLVLGACVLAVALSFRYRNAFIAALGLAGAFLTLLLLRTATSGAVFDIPYLFLLDLVATVIAIRQNWPPLIPINALWAVLCGAYLVRDAGWFASFMLLLAAMHFVAGHWAKDRQMAVNLSYIVGHACVVLAGLRFVGLEMKHGGIATTTPRF